MRFATYNRFTRTCLALSATGTKLGVAICLFVIAAAAVCAAAETHPVQTDLFVSGRGGYHTYRIPALVTTTRGTLLAFCEGRKTSRSDHGDVDLLLRHSTDGGRTWAPVQLVHEEGGTAKITIGNPCPVVDKSTGIIWLPFCSDNRDVYITSSRDDGKSWDAPRLLTPAVTKPDWQWVATGPGHGIQLDSGRLLIPCDHSPRPKGDSRRGPEAHSHVFYSDDHGRSWRLGGITGASMHECQAVQRADGSLLLSMRNYRGLERRAFTTSNDEGLTWTKPTNHPQVYCPVCQAGLLRLSSDKERTQDIILYSGPGGPGRSHMTVRVSKDGGRTWPVEKVLHEGPAAYSDLAVLPDGEMGCLYERGDRELYEKLTFARFRAEWVDLASSTTSAAQDHGQSYVAPSIIDGSGNQDTFPVEGDSRFAANSPFESDHEGPVIKPEKRLWATSFLWSKAPELVVEKWLTGEPDTAGKYVLIEFWATWCAPCRRSITLLNRLHEKYGDELVVIGISDESEEAVRKMTEPEIKFYSAIDTQARMNKQLRVQGIPHTIILEPDGYVIWEGFPLLEGYELTDEIIEKILAVGRKLREEDRRRP